jgi:hypothetical protein
MLPMLARRHREGDMRAWFEKPWFVGLGAAIIIAAAVHFGSSSLAYKDGVLGIVTQKLLPGLLAVAVFLERSLAVLNDIWFGQERETHERTLRNARGELQRAQSNLEGARQTQIAAMQAAARAATAEAAAAAKPAIEVQAAEAPTLRAKTDELSQEVQAATESLTATEGKQDRLRLGLGFLFAVVISAAGVRTLAELVSLPTGGFQLGLFQAADVLLTAGILAGGSTGINSIADLIGSYVDAARQRAGART